MKCNNLGKEKEKVLMVVENPMIKGVEKVPVGIPRAGEREKVLSCSKIKPTTNGTLRVAAETADGTLRVAAEMVETEGHGR